MPTENVNIRINAVTRGQDAVKALNANLRDLGDGSTKVQKNWAATTAIFAAGGAAIFAAAGTVKFLWNTLSEGTAIQFAQTRFENLAKTVNSTSASMLNDLRAATSGMYSDVQLMDSANQIMAVGLAKSHDGVVRMATAVGKLGIDMNQLVLELNTMRGMRLDQMGLDIVVVQAKAAELALTGMGERAAYTEAVLQAMEEKIAIQGDIAETSAGKMARAGATMANAWNDAKIGLAEFADTTGLLDLMDGHAQVMASNRAFKTSLDELTAAGVINADQAKSLALSWQWSTESQGRAIDVVTRLKAELYASADASQSQSNAMEIAKMSAASADAVMLSLAGRMEALANWSGTSAQQMLAWSSAVASAVSRVKARDFAMGEGNYYGARAKALADERAAIAATTAAIDTATGALGGYSAALDTATQRQQEFAASFSEELTTEIDKTSEAFKERQKVLEQGLVSNDGVANITAINSALYEQAQAAGLSAGQLALMGIALGEFDEKAARAALKAVLIQEKIQQLAQGVAAGKISFTDAISGAQGFAVELDTATAQTSVEDLAAAVDDYATNGPYDATVNAEVDSASNSLRNVIRLLDEIDGRQVNATANVTTAQNGTTPSVPGEPDHVPGGGRARGGRVGAGDSVWVGEHGPEKVYFDRPGYVYPHGQEPRGGMSIVVNNYNYISGSNDAQATVTADSVKGALRRIGMGA